MILSMTFRRIFFSIIFFSLWTSLSAQDKISVEQQGKWQIGGVLGYAQYYGDVSNKSYFQKFGSELGFSASAFVRYHVNDLTGIGFNIHSGRITGTKNNFSDGTAANLTFSGSVFNFDVHSYLSISNLFWGITSTRNLNIYGTLGLGFMRWSSNLQDKVTLDFIFVDNRNRIDGAGFGTSAAYFPMTLGMEYKLTKGLSATFEGTLCTVFSDDVDNYTGGFSKDMLSFTSFGLSYRFGQKGTTAKKHETTVRQTEPVAVIDYDVFKSKAVQSTGSIQALTITEPKVENIKSFEFRVQILAKTNRVENVKRYFPQVTFDYAIRENSFGGIYRYSTGSFTSFREAESYSQTMRSRGIGDAFVVAYENNIRINITKEMRLK
jgi:hypothetical protein